MAKFATDTMEDGLSRATDETRSIYLNEPTENMDESGKPTDDVFLSVLTQAISQHQQHVSGSIEKRWIDAYKNFQNQHFADSKYYSSKFRGRSKHFRPKTRAAVRTHMAAAAAALFSSGDVVQIKAQDASN